MNWTPEDIISTDKYLDAFRSNYFKTDIFYFNRPYLWRDTPQRLPIRSARFIVSGHSDYPVTDELVIRYPSAKWFSINTQTERVYGIPIGIRNNTEEEERISTYGNVNIMLDVVNTPREIKNLVHMNFAIENYPEERQLVWDLFKDKHWVTTEPVDYSVDGRKHYLQQIRNHSFVLCPRGNGVDTHRLWETLYMGSIPIVHKDIAHRGWMDLPILFIDSWEEVTEERLRNELVRFETTKWNMEKLRVGYWINRMQNEKNRIPVYAFLNKRG
jgi:hypothetical protein